MRRLVILFVAALVAVALAGCGSDPTDTPAAAPTDTGAPTIALVGPDEAAELLAAPPEGLVVLDVRTPEEFAEGHLADATLVDFYEPDFADRIAQLDPGVPYVVYCQSGNRSGQAVALMRELGFSDVTDVEGGIVAWGAAGLPLAG